MVFVLITIDTEAHRGRDPINDWIYGRYKGKEYGIEKIMDLCERFGFKAVFFLDVAECWTYGDEIIKEVGEKILSRGHDVEMHIHPDHFTKDGERLFLFQYNSEEQYSIISSCIGKFKTLFGRKPVAFRAGKYGANYETLRILDELGIRFDFSMFYKNSWCGLNNPPLTINNPTYYNSVIEIPVTVFRSFEIFAMKRLDAISLDGCSFLEFKGVLRNIINNGRPKIVVLMLHSFSFVRRDYKTLSNLKGINLGVVKKVEKEFEFLAELENKNLIKVITAQELEKIVQEGLITNEEAKDYIPSSGGICPQYLFTLNRSWRLFGKNKKATLFILLNIIGGILVGILLFKLLY